MHSSGYCGAWRGGTDGIRQSTHRATRLDHYAAKPIVRCSARHLLCVTEHSLSCMFLTHRDGEMLEFLAAARDAGRTERRQRRVAADTRVYGSRRQPSPRRSQQVHVLRMHSSSPTRRGVVALESSWDERASPSAQRGVNWGDPPIRGSINEVGGMALQRPPSPSGVPRRPTSPFSRVKEEWGHSGTDNRVAGEMVVQRRSPQRGASPTNSHMEATRFATSSAPTGRLPSTPSSPKQKQNGERLGPVPSDRSVMQPFSQLGNEYSA